MNILCSQELSENDRLEQCTHAMRADVDHRKHRFLEAHVAGVRLALVLRKWRWIGQMLLQKIIKSQDENKEGQSCVRLDSSDVPLC